MMIIPAAYELHVNEDGTYSLVIQGAIKFDGLAFAEAVARIYATENGEYPDIKEETKKCLKSK